MAEENEEAGLWQRSVSMEALQAAWYKVHANEGSAGGDGISRRDFRADLYANLTQLRADLLSGTYCAAAFRKVSIPKKKPGYRLLTIPSIRDRVLHTSIATVLTPIFEPLFEECSFAYRPNRGVVHAVARIEKWRGRGYDVVIEADVVSYFDNVDQELLLEKVTAIIAPLEGSAPLLALIRSMLDDQARALGTPGKGLVQGSPLSPLLANLYLDALDEEIERQGVKIVRFADDFVILCKSEKKARKVLQHCVKVLDDHGLKLHEDGTRIVNFDKGFDFIGYLFLKTLALKEKSDPQKKPGKPVKSEVTDEGIITLDQDGSRFDPGRRVLYVLDLNHCLCVRNRSFSVEREDGSELIAIPYKRIGRIEVGPGIDFSRTVIDLALDGKIEISLLDRHGQTRGLAAATFSKRAGVQFSQAAAILDDEFRTIIARRLVEARIRNQRVQLMRLTRGKDIPEAETSLQALQGFLRRAEFCHSINELRGLEGAGTATYWHAIGRLVDHQSSEPFRRTRPAQDPPNSAINYLTAILERDTRAAIQAVHLHPGFAFLHGTRDRHDGLVYDLMEPFRAPLTEGLAVFLFNARRLRADMFTNDAEGETIISPEGRKAIIEGYETAVARRINKPGGGGGKLGWREMMRHQAQGLANAVANGNTGSFNPYLMEA